MRNPHTCSVFSVLKLDWHNICLRKHEPLKKKSQRNVPAAILSYVKIFTDVSRQGLLCLWLPWNTKPSTEIHQSLPVECWDWRHTPAHQAYCVFWWTEVWSLAVKSVDNFCISSQAFEINCMPSNRNIPNFISSQGKEVKNVVCRWGK